MASMINSFIPLRSWRLSLATLLVLTGVSSVVVGIETTQTETVTNEKREELPLDHDAVLSRVDEELRYLTSDELEGRGVETEGIHKASDYIVAEFKKAGLTSGVEDGSYLQPFPVQLGRAVSTENCELQLSGPDGATISFEVEKDYLPHLIGGEGEVESELVFVGYGITAKDLEFEEYDGIDVEGKVVVIMRSEPGQNDEESKFNGTNPSSHAYIMTKLTAAKLNKAAAVIFVNDPVGYPKSEVDELAPIDQFGRNSMGVPFVHVKQAKISEVLESTPLKDSDGNELASLSAIQDAIEKTQKPLSQAIEGWSAKIKTGFESSSVETYNVVGVVEGEGPLANETVVIGGHYDHLGYGGYGSRAPGRNEIHYGADDNATGTVAVLELARRFAHAEKKPARRLVFIAFSGEERGLIGSRYYCNEEPLFPLEDTVAMINFDMIGRLRNRSLTVFGSSTSEVFEDLINQAAEGLELDMNIPRSGFGGSDHLPFYQKEIPDVFIHTGLHDVYHTPEDTYETINVSGMVDVIDFSENFVKVVDQLEQRPTFVSASARPRRAAASYLGAIPDFESSDEGIYVQGVADDSPAKKGGIEVGDVILSIAGTAVKDRNSLVEVYQKNRPGTEVKVIIKRDDEEIELDITLGENPRRRR